MKVTLTSMQGNTRDINLDTKELVIKLTHHLDALEHNYNRLLEEYKSRNIK